MSLFSPINNGRAVLVTKGVYTDVPLYSYSDRLYAKYRGGFIRLLAQDLTSVGSTQWRAVEGVDYFTQHDGLHIDRSKPTRLKVAK